MSLGGSRRARPAAAAAAAIVLAGALLAGCLIDRKSSEYRCRSTADCDPGRTCDRGFCVENEADPSLCTQPGCEEACAGDIPCLAGACEALACLHPFAPECSTCP